MLRKTPQMIKTVIRWMDLWAIEQADGVILADESRKEQIAGSQPKLLEVVYNSPQDQLESLEGQPGSQVGFLRVSYIGLLQYERGLFDLIEVISKHPDWMLDLGGSGPEKEIIRDRIRSCSNINWHGFIPHEKTLELNAAADVMIAIFDPAIPNNRYSSSNKLFEAMMLQKPIVVARNTNMDKIVENHDCGIIIEYGNLGALEAALHNLAQDPGLRQQLGENARLAYEQFFNWEEMQARLLNFYTEILSI
jgi:glycosyltransferase involved in cell wall biosynthesis